MYSKAYYLLISTAFLFTLPNQAEESRADRPQEHSPAGNPTPGCSDPEPLSGTRTVELDEVPEGGFRDGLLGLEPVVLNRVLETLVKLGFHPADAEALRVDPDGVLSFTCRFHEEGGSCSEQHDPVAAPDTVYQHMAESSGTAGLTGLVSISAPPIRHSRLGAQKVLYLDFNGHLITNTRWNSFIPQTSSYTTRPYWDCRPYDIDGDEMTFSVEEQRNIVRIWERVAEDFAPFDVNVTTEQPAAWNRYTGHALITPHTDRNGYRCPHYNSGGRAFATPVVTNEYLLGVFGHPEYSYNADNCYSPVMINSTDPASGMGRKTDFIAETVSHELGHNLGLGHDGFLLVGKISIGYSPGYNRAPITWAPIMGEAYLRDVTQWSKGEYKDYLSNTPQGNPDDLEIMAEKLSYRLDDHGNTPEEATMLKPAPDGSVYQTGVIEQTGDPDVFSFQTAAGGVMFQASPYRDTAGGPWGGNLDILLELYDASGALLAEANPEQETEAVISEYLPGGLYYLHVKPVGAGDPFGDPASGYTVYGSLGQYTLTGHTLLDTDGDKLPDDWEISWFDSTTADSAEDPDGDGQNNLSEYIAGTDPTNGASHFTVAMHSLIENRLELRWVAVEGRRYSVWRARSLTEIFKKVITLPYPADRWQIDFSLPPSVEHSEFPAVRKGVFSSALPALLLFPTLPHVLHTPPSGTPGETGSASSLESAFYRVEVQLQ